MAKQTDKLLKWAGIFAVAYFALNNLGNYALSKIGFGMPSLRVQSWHPTEVRVEFTQPLTNSTGAAIPVQSIQGVIRYGQNVLTNFYINQAFTIEAHDTTNLRFSAVIEYATLTQSVANIIDSQEWLQALIIEGHAVSGGVVFPFSETVRVGV